MVTKKATKSAKSPVKFVIVRSHMAGVHFGELVGGFGDGSGDGSGNGGGFGGGFGET